MIKHKPVLKLKLKHDTLRLLAPSETTRAAGGTYDSCNVDGCGPGNGNSWQNTCLKTL